MKNFAYITLAFIGFFVFITTTQAFEMRSPSVLQLRQGPGNHYAKSSQISSGQNIEIGICNPSWCYVTADQESGWVVTATIDPNWVKTNKNSRHYQASASTINGSDLASFSGQKLASADMSISVRIVAKDDMKRKNKG